MSVEMISLQVEMELHKTHLVAEAAAGDSKSI